MARGSWLAPNTAQMPIRKRLAASVSTFFTLRSSRSMTASVSALGCLGSLANTDNALLGHFTPSANTIRRSSSLNVAKKSRDTFSMYPAKLWPPSSSRASS